VPAAGVRARWTATEVDPKRLNRPTGGFSWFESKRESRGPGQRPAPSLRPGSMGDLVRSLPRRATATVVSFVSCGVP
jgi:hypothetical protein